MSIQTLAINRSIPILKEQSPLVCFNENYITSYIVIKAESQSTEVYFVDHKRNESLTEKLQALRCYIYNTVNNHNMGMTELYIIYIRKESLGNEISKRPHCGPPRPPRQQG